MTPELVLLLSKFRHHANGREFGPLSMISDATDPIHDESSVESGFEPGTLRSQCRDLTTRPPRPQLILEIKISGLQFGWMQVVESSLIPKKVIKLYRPEHKFQREMPDIRYDNIYCYQTF
ncbi:hypothetical protein AVEN_246276-1 [Araneus ventricosus]|uniref:Uncharacterized protein n=1 Tax=Araneus ventricosus TaxID=182803 RepID=A0A4Y2S6S8_ARAVE|nr:hypothetical protein AVEN_246276-1 [Araneus ventricosus]